MKEVITSSCEETEFLGAALAGYICAPFLILLDGDLAAGKTTLVRGFARGFKSKDDTSSPTFTLLNIYESPRGRINHLDLYRIGDADELEAIGFSDYLHGVTFVEWPAVAGESLREQADLIIEIDILDETTRRFRLIGDEKFLSRLELPGGRDE